MSPNKENEIINEFQDRSDNDESSYEYKNLISDSNESYKDNDDESSITNSNESCKDDDSDFTYKNDYSYRNNYNGESDNQSKTEFNNHFDTEDNKNNEESNNQSKTKYNNKNNPSQGMAFDKNIKYLKKDLIFDKAVGDVINKIDDSKHQNIYRALLYCEKAVTCMPKNLIKNIVVSYRKNIKNEDKIELLYLSNEEVDIVYDFFENERINFGSDDMYIVESTLMDTLLYIYDVYNNIINDDKLPHLGNVSRMAVKYNKDLFDIMKNSIIEAFPDFVVDLIFKKSIHVSGEDHIFNLFELHLYHNLIFALDRDK